MAPRSQSTPSVWTVMSYTPPRGRCNHKTSLMSPACPCLRFMLHPVKAATSFECDGCGHHASFHSMENKEDEAIVKKWKAVESEQASGSTRAGQANGGAATGRKRRRIANQPANADESGTEKGEVRTGAELREILEIEDDHPQRDNEASTGLLPGSFIATPGPQAPEETRVRQLRRVADKGRRVK